MTVENDKPVFFGFGTTDFFSLNLAFNQDVAGTSAVLQTGVWEINFEQGTFEDNSVPSSSLTLPSSFDSNATVRLLETLGTPENPIFAPTDLNLSLGGFDVDAPETPPMSAVPLPATGSMLIAAAGILAMVRRRKRSA